MVDWTKSQPYFQPSSPHLLKFYLSKSSCFLVSQVSNSGSVLSYRLPFDEINEMPLCIPLIFLSPIWHTAPCGGPSIIALHTQCYQPAHPPQSREFFWHLWLWALTSSNTGGPCWAEQIHLIAWSQGTTHHLRVGVKIWHEPSLNWDISYTMHIQAHMVTLQSQMLSELKNSNLMRGCSYFGCHTS